MLFFTQKLKDWHRHRRTNWTEVYGILIILSYDDYDSISSIWRSKWNHLFKNWIRRVSCQFLKVSSFVFHPALKAIRKTINQHHVFWAWNFVKIIWNISKNYAETHEKISKDQNSWFLFTINWNVFMRQPYLSIVSTWEWNFKKFCHFNYFEVSENYILNVLVITWACRKFVSTATHTCFKQIFLARLASDFHLAVSRAEIEARANNASNLVFELTLQWTLP